MKIRFATEIQRYFSPCQEHLYYAFRQGPVYCIVLDTGEDKPDSDIEYAGITQYDLYRTEQSEWLASILESTEYKEAPFKIIVAHIPPAVTEAGPDEDWHGNVEVEQKFMPLLRQAYPDLMLCGHLHRFVRHDATDKTSFPVVVNSNTSLLRIYATTTQMKIEVMDRDGKMLDEFILIFKNIFELRCIDVVHIIPYDHPIVIFEVIGFTLGFEITIQYILSRLPLFTQFFS